MSLIFPFLSVINPSLFGSVRPSVCMCACSLHLISFDLRNLSGATQHHLADFVVWCVLVPHHFSKSGLTWTRFCCCCLDDLCCSAPSSFHRICYQQNFSSMHWTGVLFFWSLFLLLNFFRLDAFDVMWLDHIWTNSKRSSTLPVGIVISFDKILALGIVTAAIPRASALLTLVVWDAGWWYIAQDTQTTTPVHHCACVRLLDYDWLYTGVHVCVCIEHWYTGHAIAYSHYFCSFVSACVAVGFMFSFSCSIGFLWFDPSRVHQFILHFIVFAG